jgi:hypothetical protein
MLVLKPQYGVALIGNPIGATPQRKNASCEVFVASAPLAGRPPARTYKSSNVQFNATTEAAQFPFIQPARQDAACVNRQQDDQQGRQDGAGATRRQGAVARSPGRRRHPAFRSFSRAPRLLSNLGRVRL